MVIMYGTVTTTTSYIPYMVRSPLNGVEEFMVTDLHNLNNEIIEKISSFIIFELLSFYIHCKKLIDHTSFSLCYHVIS